MHVSRTCHWPSCLHLLTNGAAKLFVLANKPWMQLILCFWKFVLSNILGSPLEYQCPSLPVHSGLHLSGWHLQSCLNLLLHLAHLTILMIQSVWKNLTGLIPAEHLWCNFKCRPWAKNSSPNTNDLYFHCMDKSTGTPPSLEEKKAFPNCDNKDGNIIHVLKNCISTSVATCLKCMKWRYPYAQVIGVWWWVCGSFKVTPEVFSWD